MSKNLFVIAGIVILFHSCKENEAEQETFKFPIQLYPVEVSRISDARFFIHGQEIFDTDACNSFMRSEWMDEFESIENDIQYDFFDESDFLNSSYVPKTITFLKKDSAMFRTSSYSDPQWEELDKYKYYSVEWYNPLLIFHYLSSNDYLPSSLLTKKSSIRILTKHISNKYKIANDDWADYYRELQTNIKKIRNRIEGNTTAKGDYTEFELNIVNYRYIQWQRDNAAENFGVLARYIGEINYEEIVNTMQETDTLVFQEFKIKYKTH